MKKLFLLIFLFIGVKLFACECTIRTYISKFESADIVLRGKVLKVYENSNEVDDYYKIEVEIIDLFKGNPIKSFFVKGGSDASCGINVRENTDWIIFASIDSDNTYSFDLCSGGEQIDRVFSDKYEGLTEFHLKEMEFKLEILDFFKSKNINYVNKFRLFQHGGFGSHKEVPKHELKERFAFFQIKLDSTLKVKNIVQLKGFDSRSLNRKLKRSIKKMGEWKCYGRKKLPESIIKTVGYFYHSNEDLEEYCITIFE